MSSARPFRIELHRRRPDYPVAAVLRFSGSDGETKLALPFRLTRELSVLNGVVVDPTWRADVVTAEDDANVEIRATPQNGAWLWARSVARMLGLNRGSFRLPAAAHHIQPVAPWLSEAPPDVNPSVTIVIPTRDRPELLKRAVDTLFLDPRRPRTDLVIVDNGSVETSTFALLKDLNRNSDIQVLRIDEPFNFARLINKGVEIARGDVLALLNNDIWSEDHAWCDPLALLATDVRVGAVGTKLLQPNGLVQHAGITLGIGGLCGHAGRGRSNTDPGPGALLTTTRQVSAVTGACLFTRRSIFDQLGGLDERYVVEFNDVDYCIRANALGLAVVCAAEPVLYHAEGSSRRSTPVRTNEYADRVRFVLQWGRHVLSDPHYPSGLSYDNEFLTPAEEP